MNGNEKRIRAIEARLKTNTLASGPWSPTGRGGVRRAGTVIFHDRGAPFLDHSDLANADFTAHARDDVPWLVARVRQLETAFEAARAVLPRNATAALALDAVDRDPIDEE